MSTFAIYQADHRVGIVRAESPADALSVFRRPGAPDVIEMRAYKHVRIATRKTQ